jgi:Cof subfamily protein (haloacid dehalogenase superfamily)
MIRLIGIDVDGTLLDSQGRLPDANRDAIHEAVERGIHVALVTGRSFPYARPVAESLPAAISLIVSSGAVERTMDGGTVARRLLDRRVARDLLVRTAQHRHCSALIFDRDVERQLIAESMDWTHPGRQGYWMRNQQLIAQCVPLEDALVEDPIQVMFNGDVHAMRDLAAELQREARDYAVSLTEYVHRDFSLIDVTAPTATKGRALAWRAAQLGVSRHEVMAVGDNLNDVEMLEYAGTPVVMANAVDGLRDRGWPMTGHHDEAGLAAAIRLYALV